MSDLLLTTQKLTRTFGKTEVLRDLDLTISEGEFVAVMGPSGSGKSTLLQLLATLDRPTDGTVRFMGADLADHDEAGLASLRLHHMGFVFQHPYLLHGLDLRDNVAFPGLAAGTDRAAVYARVDQLMRAAGVADVGEHAVTEASGGQLQRVAVCRALINNPEIVFADEPTGALNASATESVLDLLEGVHADGTTLVMVTHDPLVAARAQRVVFLGGGRVQGEWRHTTPETMEPDAAELSAWLVGQGF